MFAWKTAVTGVESSLQDTAADISLGSIFPVSINLHYIPTMWNTVWDISNGVLSNGEMAI